MGSGTRSQELDRLQHLMRERGLDIDDPSSHLTLPLGASATGSAASSAKSSARGSDRSGRRQQQHQHPPAQPVRAIGPSAQEAEATLLVPNGDGADSHSEVSYAYSDSVHEEVPQFLEQYADHAVLSAVSVVLRTRQRSCGVRCT